VMIFHTTSRPALRAAACGGRPRPADRHGSNLPARAAHQLPDVGPDQPNRLGLPHDDHQCDKTGDYQEGEPRPNARWAFTISVLLHPLVLIG
jgi:hypothetical protein